MQAAAGHNVRLAAEKPCGGILDVHQLKKPKRPLGMIEEKIGIGVLADFVARRGAEQVQVFDPEPLRSSSWRFSRKIASSRVMGQV